MSLIETIVKLVPQSVFADAARGLGEDESAIRTGLGALVPMLLGGMIQKSSSQSGLDSLFSMLNKPDAANVLENLSGLIGGGNLAQGDPKDAAGQLVGSLFGDKTGSLLSALSGFAGFKSKDSAGGLLGLAGPLVMGFLAKKISADGLNAAGLGKLLAGEKNNIAKALPAPLAGLMGFAAPTSAPLAAANDESDRRGAFGWLWPLLIAAAIAAAIWFLLMNNRRPRPAEPAPAPVVEMPTTPEVAPSVPEPISIETVLQGIDLSTIPATGAERRLIDFINSGREPCTDPDCWFTMDRLTFQSGAATLDMERSGAQLANLKLIMDAFPNVQIKFGGYTDNTGREEANMALSEQRAQAVVEALAALGVPRERMVAEGYGSQFPVASNDTEEGRAANRRIDVRVRQR